MHCIIYKFDYYGIRGILLLNWLTSFLQNRSQKVIVEGMNSSSCNVTSGIYHRDLFSAQFYS